MIKALNQQYNLTSPEAAQTIKIMGWKNGTLETKNLRIQITNQHISYKGTWVIHVRELNWNCRILGIPDDSTEKFAQEEAIRQIRQQMILMIEELKP